ncbi:MAG: sigma-70 family RNA polymerase sigma factor [Pseudomonadota bacterium]
MEWSVSGVARQGGRALETFITRRRDLIALANAVVGNRSIAEELVQDSWLVWSTRAYPQHRAGPILKRIVLNLARDRYRRQRVEWRYLQFGAPEPDAAPDTERHYIARETIEQVVAALEELPERTLAAFRMHRLDGLTYAQIGERLDIVPSRAHQLVRNALLHIALRVDE